MAFDLTTPHSSPRRTGLLTVLALIAFAGNSLLCRLALTRTSIDAASFTTIRLVAGAVVLILLVTLRAGGPRPSGSWPSALALFVYAAGFSFAYVKLTAGTGALLLFGAVQATMIGYGLSLASYSLQISACAFPSGFGKNDRSLVGRLGQRLFRQARGGPKASAGIGDCG